VTDFESALGAVGLDQVDQRLPMHHHFHHSKKFLAFGLLHRSSELIIREASCLPTINPILAYITS
jgi:hypothetical protein